MYANTNRHTVYPDYVINSCISYDRRGMVCEVFAITKVIDDGTVTPVGFATDAMQVTPTIEKHVRQK